MEDQGESGHKPLPVSFEETGPIPGIAPGSIDMAGVQADQFLASSAGITADKGPLSSYIDSGAQVAQPGAVAAGMGVGGGGGAPGQPGGQFGGVPVGIGGAGDTAKLGGGLPGIKMAKAKAGKK